MPRAGLPVEAGGRAWMMVEQQHRYVAVPTFDRRGFGESPPRKSKRSKHYSCMRYTTLFLQHYQSSWVRPEVGRKAQTVPAPIRIVLTAMTARWTVRLMRADGVVVSILRSLGARRR